MSESAVMSFSGFQLTSCCFLTSGLLDNVTVLIGIAYGGKAIAGVINQPFYNYQVQAKSKLCSNCLTALLYSVSAIL